MQAKSGNPQDIGKNDPLGDLPSPSGAVDKAVGAIKGLTGDAKGLAGDAKQGSKNVASDLSEDIPNLFKDVGKNAEKVCIGFLPLQSSPPGNTQCLLKGALDLI